MDREFVALGHAGSEAYAGLESFPNPGVDRVELISDELTAMCPITNQPDFYTATIDDAAMVASCLAALGGDRHAEAATALRAVSKLATSPRRASGVA